MIILETKSNLVGSKFIRWGTEQESSHMAIYFPYNGMVLHAKFTGVDIDHISTFKKKNQIVRAIQKYPTDPTHDVETFLRLVKHEGTYYDYLALFWLGVKHGLRKVGINISFREEKWQNSSYFVCTEYALRAAGKPSRAALLPAEVVDLLLDSQEWKPCRV